jgi:dTDP-4-dehydrorhamnose 3,5-epimerase
MSNTAQPSFSITTAQPVQGFENWYSTSLSGLWYYHSKVFKDNRGYYSELSHTPDIEAVTKQPFPIKQLNLARSEQNVIRGFHAEQWNKMVCVSQGEAFCAIADVRPDSPTFGQVETFVLGHSDASLPGVLFISAGFGNSLCVLNGPVDYFYAVDQLYRERDTQHDVAISLFDPNLAITWPINREVMIISERDSNSVTLKEKFPQKFAT